MGNGLLTSGVGFVFGGRYVLRAAPTLFLICLVGVLAGCLEQQTAPDKPGPVIGPVEPTVPDSPGPGKTVEPNAPKTVKQQPRETPGAKPEIRFDKVVHDWGTVGPGSSHEATFTFTNKGTAPLTVTRVKTCCSVVAKLGGGKQLPVTLNPGQSDTVELKYSAGTQVGNMRRQVIVYSSDPAKAQVALTIKAEIVRRVEYEPKRLSLFLKKENAGLEPLVLTSVDDKPFSITSFYSTAGAITTEFDPAVKATKFVLELTADMEKLEKNLKGRVNVTTTHPEGKTISLLYDVLPQFTVNPPQIILLYIKPEVPVEREIWVLNNYREDFEIESLSSQKGTIEVLSKAKQGNRWSIKVKITPPKQEEGKTLMTDVLLVDIKGADQIKIGCRGFY